MARGSDRRADESTASMLRRALRVCAHERAMLFGRTALAESKTAKKIFGGRISVAQSAARQSAQMRNSQLTAIWFPGGTMTRACGDASSSPLASRGAIAKKNGDAASLN